MAQLSVRQIVSYIIIVILFFLAVFLGFLIYGKVVNKKSSTVTDSQNRTAQKFSINTSPSGLTASERFLLTPLGSKATKEEIDAYLRTASIAAKDTQPLNLNKCVSPSPFVEKIQIGKSLAVKNDDSISYNIRLNSGDGYTIPANSTKIIKINFKKGTGVYTYFCDGISGIAGFFFATK